MKLTTSALIATVAFGMLQPAFAAGTNGSVATVNGKPIKQSLYDYIAKEASSRGQTVDDNVKNVIINKLIGSELIYQEAQRTGLDKQPDYLAKEELTRRELLVNTFLQDYIKKNPVSEADIKLAYEKYKQELGDKEYSARHILVSTEAEAKDIIAQLGKGGDFAKLAKEKSKDPGSQEKGGDLGWFSAAGMVKPFSDAVVKLQKGKYTTTPVQTQFGWHVIKLEDTRATQPPSYDDVKDGLQKQLQQRNLEKLLTDLRSKAKIEAPAGATAAK
ncbi:PpiC-type peptidyl-prolyl cis-trans isomerase [Methylobacillus flagellatus KT]|uniref:peptidylprolyl isomerase n=2 Tax=Methylophilaceae TaxID=32011 RepID=Q1H039_METFK|nr:PpiC-type peptidyl-prolyl cis-trans isomerase [Methylobacillus flagellatus KT]MPS48622.1 peptidylprolyl isomerase [Methylobacillus sp.]